MSNPPEQRPTGWGLDRWITRMTPAPNSEPATDQSGDERARVFDFHGMTPTSAARMVERVDSARAMVEAFEAVIPTIVQPMLPHNRIQPIDQGTVIVPPFPALQNPAPTLQGPDDVLYGSDEFGEPSPYGVSEYNKLPEDKRSAESAVTVGKAAASYMMDQGFTFAASLLAHFLSNEKGMFDLGEEYIFRNSQMEKIVNSPWIKEALYAGQDFILVNPGAHPDLKWVPPGTKGDGVRHNPGMNEIIANTVTRARTDESLLNTPIPFTVPWMRTTDRGYEADKADTAGSGADIHNALGHYTAGASGTMILTQNPDKSISYTVVYNVQAWDYYNFVEMADRTLQSEYAPPSDGSGNWFKELMARGKQSALETVNNVMLEAHRRGKARNFIDHGESALRLRQGTVGADGKLDPNIRDGLLEPPK
ncbi:hypothetical protein [Nocardia sp. NPDC050175]|uniref:hypothetical protein n=1 Tax=Nocardia sp. NPDC050175 TaxID=3364317 RepID=UPI0037B05E0D